MPIQTEVWVRDIAANLFPANSFCVQGINDSAFVDNKKVHLPQTGAKPKVVRNRTVFPIVGASRADTVVDYQIDEYSSDTTIIRDIEEIETSYAKRQNVLAEHKESLMTQIANWMAFHWSPTEADALVRTTGGSRDSFIAGSTGQRKKILLDDILAAKRTMDSMDIPTEGRKMLLPSEMYNDLLEIDKVLSADFNQTGKLPDGVVNRLFGFDIMIRSSVVSYSNAAAPVLRAPDAAALTTANAAALAWHPRFVRYAKGGVKVFSHLDDPDYQGSTFNAQARAGGRKRYTDGRGVVAIVEAAGA